jgi:hypothetical protein
MALTTQISFVSSSPAVNVTVDILPGSLQKNREDDVRGQNSARGVHAIKAGVGRSGSCEALVETSGLTVTVAKTLISPIGEGSFTVTDVTNSEVLAYKAIVDVVVQGRAVTVAKISWNGTKN